MVVDGCTLWPNSWGEASWEHCCDAHDAAFYNLEGFFVSNIELAACVANTGGYFVALVMFAGVSTFGLLFYFKAHVEAFIRHIRKR